MDPLVFRPDLKLTDVIRQQGFTLSAEVIPPRNGSDQAKILQQIQLLIKAGAQFLAVTKGAGGSLRGGSLPIAQLIKERFNVPCIAHFTCRDLLAPEIENQLMDHHYFGIRNILALRGDPPDGQKEWEARPGAYSYAYQLIEQIQKLNSGTYLPRINGPQADSAEKTDFCIGAAAYPDFASEKERIEYFKVKVMAGAQFGITDMLFDPTSYARFQDDLAKEGVQVPILVGTRLLKTKTQARKMVEKFKTRIPDEVLAKLPEIDGPDASAYGLELFLKLSEKLKSYGAPGIHLYVIVDTAGACFALKGLADSHLFDKKDKLENNHNLRI